VTPDNADPNKMRWYDSLAAAQEAATKDHLPVMVAVTRDGKDEDDKAIEKLSSWAVAITLSNGKMAAVEVADTAEGKDLTNQTSQQTLPALVWADNFSNGILAQSFPDSAQALSDVVGKWKNTLSSVDKYFKDHESRGEKLLGKGKLREAYLEFAFVAPFKGPEPDKAKEGQAKIKEAWLKLVDVAQNLPADSRGRSAVLKGVRRDVAGLDCAPAIEEAAGKVDGAKVAATKDAKPGSAMPAVGNKPLAQVAATAFPQVTVESDDAAIDTRVLSNGTDDRLKKAEKLIQEAVSAYKKATADSAERGEARNGLLTDAHAKFEMALILIEAVTGNKPDAQTEKLMDRVGMLMYGCMKHRSS